MKNGFTKIEVLIFILLIVIVVAMDIFVILYLNAKNRDIQVLSEVDQIRSGLEVYLLKNNKYPGIEDIMVLNDNYQGTEKLCTDGFKKITDNCVRNILNPIPNQYSSIYRYKSDQAANDYMLEYELMTDFKSLGLSKGKICVTNIQILSQPCF